MGHAVNVTSGGDISTFSFGFSYTSQKPVIGLEEPEIKQMYERYTLRLNSVAKPPVSFLRIYSSLS